MSETYFANISASIWQGREEQQPKQRYYQIVNLINQRLDTTDRLDNHLCLVGFCTDTGVLRNQGRKGAKDGPDALRRALAALPYHPSKDTHEYSIVDCGNVLCPDEDLESAQTQCAEFIKKIRQKGGLSCLLGGGHEIAWAHYQGLTDINQEKDFAIVNFDAHFDMRPMVNGLGNSGTPFLQVAKHRKNQNLPFHYYCIGVRQSSNTASLYETAAQWGVNYLSYEEICTQPDALNHFIKQILSKHKSIYLTVCLDVFSSSVAPGVSASAPIGLMPWHVLPHIETLAQSAQVKAFDIAELAPNLDQNHSTAKLGAFILEKFLSCYHG